MHFTTDYTVQETMERRRAEAREYRLGKQAKYAGRGHTRAATRSGLTGFIRTLMSYLARITRLRKRRYKGHARGHKMLG